MRRRRGINGALPDRLVVSTYIRNPGLKDFSICTTAKMKFLLSQSEAVQVKPPKKNARQCTDRPWDHSTSVLPSWTQCGNVFMLSLVVLDAPLPECDFTPEIVDPDFRRKRARGKGTSYRPKWHGAIFCSLRPYPVPLCTSRTCLIVPGEGRGTRRAQTCRDRLMVMPTSRSDFSNLTTQLQDFFSF